MPEPRDELMLARIRALLAKAERTEYEAERDAYNSRAGEMVAKYGIDRALLTNAGVIRDVVGGRIISVLPPYRQHKSMLLEAVAVPLRVRTVHLRNGGVRRPDKGVSVHLFGFAADLDRLEILFTSLLTQASLQMATLPGSDRRSFLLGFIDSIKTRLIETEDRATRSASTGTELVLVGRVNEVEAARSAAYPKTSAYKSRLIGSSAAAYGQGQSAGQRADLGGTRVRSGGQKEVGR